MDEARNLSSQEKENLAGNVMESLGEPEKSTVQIENAPLDGATDSDKEDLPPYAKEKIGKIKQRHERDLRRMQRQMNDMQARLGSMNQPLQGQPIDQYVNEHESPNSNIDEQIHKAVSYALRAKEAEERKAEEQRQAQYVMQQYEKLNDHLDKSASKYDDFDDVVRGHDVPFTSAIRDAALLVDNPGDVLYKLGKDKEKLAQISKLHPLDQAREIWKLSVALMGGNDMKKDNQNQSRPLGQIKSNPAIQSQSVNENTPVGDLRRLMRANWKTR